MKHILIAFLLTLTLTGCFKTREDIAREREEKELQASLQQNVVQTGQGVENLQAEIGRLQGRIEELDHRRQKELSSGLASSREGSDKALSELKGQIASLQQSQAAIFEEIKKLKEDNIQLSKAVAERPHAAPVSSAQKKSAGQSGNYDAALKAYLAKDFDAAINGFRSYLEVNAAGKKANAAHYYLGDCLFRNKDYQNAIMEFGVVHEKTPTTTLGRKSTLKLAESFKALGKPKDAKAFAQLLVQSSPESAEAKQAKKFLK
ncbi:MAG: tetratricopeptide repeat protein [Bdellovibrionota bacterium]